MAPSEGEVESVMVTKVVLTLLVILAAYVYLKRRRIVSQPRLQTVDDSPGLDKPFRLIAVLLLIVSLTGAVGYAIYHWIDGHQLLEVTLVSPGADEPLLYRVYKSELNERSFTTVDGQIIRMGSQDRLQVEALSE